MTEAQFRSAFDGHKDTVYRFAFRLMGGQNAAQEAEDVAQEAFLALWRRPEGYDATRGELRSYLIGVARNLVLKKWRARHPTVPLDDEHLQIADGTVPDLALLARRDAIAAAVGRLPVLQREALILAEYEELSLEEIARATGAEVAAVKSRLHRARTNLRQMLAGLLSVGAEK